MPFTLRRWDGPDIVTFEDVDNQRDAVIKAAKLRIDLYRANLRGSNLRDSNLSGSDLRGSDLRDSNLRDSNLSSLAPHITIPSLHRRILAALQSGGSLQMDGWHKCETTHCRAGWAIHLAGPAGAVLEACFGPAVAGALISVTSCPALEGKVPDFYANNEEALADIKRLAALEPELAEALEGRQLESATP